MSAAPPPERLPGLLGRLGMRHRRDVLLLILVVVGGAYLAYAVLFQGWKYLELKTSAKAAPMQLRAARWQDAALQCPGEPRIGAQLDKLFEAKYEGFVTRMLWDSLPPRYELLVAGKASPQRGFELRHLVMTIDLESNDRAVLRDAVIAGESGHLDTAKQWLAAACTK